MKHYLSYKLSFLLVVPISLLMACGGAVSTSNGNTDKQSSGGRTFDQFIEDETLCEKYTQAFSDPKVDFLVVMDNSGSMSGEQTLLAAGFDQFFGAWPTELDYQIGVVSTD